MFNEQKSMRISVEDNRLLSDVQLEFNTYFPYLKLEFFRAPHKIGEGSAKKLLMDNRRRIKDCRSKSKTGDLIFSAETTVADLENTFFRDFGLSAQVFRRSGNVWLETSATDSWSLMQQNSEGAELSAQIREKRENPDDTDMY